MEGTCGALIGAVSMLGLINKIPQILCKAPEKLLMHLKSKTEQSYADS